MTAPRAHAQLDALRSFVARRPTTSGATAPSSASAARVLVVGSGKGGAGTSVVAALVALAAAASGKRVLLVDADPFVGPQRYLLGIGAAPSLADARALSGADVASLAVPVSATLSLVPGGPGATSQTSHAMDAAEQRALLRRVSALYPEHDLVVLDGGSRLDTVCACCETSGGAGAPARLLVVTETDPIALAASYALVKAARERTAALGGPVAADVIVNRHDDEAGLAGFARIAEACAAFLGANVRHAGTLPDDGSLALALRAGMPLQDAAAGSPAAVAAQALVERLLADLAEGDARPPNERPHDRTSLRTTYVPPFRPSAVPTGALR